MTKQAYVLTHWVGTGAANDAFRPAIGDAYPLLSYRDVTAHPSASIPPSPNLFMAVCAVSDATALLIAADAAYHFLPTYQREMLPTAAQFSTLTAWLATKTGRTLAQVRSVIGGTVNARAWEDILIS